MKKSENIITFTPEQIDAIKAFITSKFFDDFKDEAYQFLYYDVGGDLIKRNYEAIEDDKKFVKAWNEAFEKHFHGFAVNNKFISFLEEKVSDYLNDRISDEWSGELFTAASVKKAIGEMEKNVKSFLKGEEGQEVVRKGAEKGRKEMEELKKQIEQLGYRVTIEGEAK